MRNEKGQFIKGHIPPFKNSFVPKEVRKKISNTLKRKKIMPPDQTGFRHSEITKKKIGIVAKGRPKSIETLRKLSISHQGEKSGNWKGGISSENERLRGGLDFRLWRKAVFKRDNFTCQECKIKGGILHPHHIKSFAKYPELRFIINNGRTLCKDCHQKKHKKIKLSVIK